MKNEIWFDSKNVKCAGWLTYPENVSNKNVPIVIMAHGFGSRKEILLEQYAKQFNELGFATLIFDYRHWGDSEGMPRHLHDYRKQIEDWESAVKYVKTLSEVDKNKIVLWGTSFAGGLVLTVASRNHDIAATISQCPMLDGKASSVQFIQNAGLLLAMRSGINATYDIVKSLIGGEPHYVNTVGKPGTLAAMSTQEAYDMHPRFLAAYPQASQGKYYNKVTARSLLLVGKYRPILDVDKIKCPSLLLVCEKDSVAPAISVEKAIKLMSKAVPVRFPGLGHFDIYFDEGFAMSIKEQLDFLKKHVL